MSEDKKDVAVVDPKSTAVTTYDEELARYARSSAAAERPTAQSISFKAGQISYAGTPVKDNRLACVIVGNAIENRWYKQKYKEGIVVNPACFALEPFNMLAEDPQENEEALSRAAAHDNSAEPQGAGEGHNCVGCPKAEWGTDPEGGRGKACSQNRRIIVIPATALQSPEMVDQAEMAVARVSVTSVKYLSAYISKLETSLRRPPWAVVTEISTQPDMKTQFRVNFNAVANVPNEVLAALKKKCLAAMPLLILPYEEGGATTSTAAPAQESKKY